MINLIQLLSASIDLVERGGAIIREVASHGNLQTQMKKEDDPLTIADLRVQSLLEGGFRSLWPNIQLVGEEEIGYDRDVPVPNVNRFHNEDVNFRDFDVPMEDVMLYVDPLDGTKAFTQGEYEVVSILIGICLKNIPVGGVVHQPFAENYPTHWGLKNFKTHIVDMNPNTRSMEDLIIVTSKSHCDQEIQNAIDHLNPKQVLRVGGAGYKCILVFKGIIDLYLFPIQGTSKWDICAPQGIIEALGGKITDRYGRNIEYNINDDKTNKHGIVVSLKNHDYIISRLSELYTLN